MAADAFRSFRSMVDRLAACPRIDLALVRLEPGVADPSVRAAKLGLSLAEPVETFYRQVGRFELDWYAKDGSITGEVRIHPLDEMLKVRSAPSHWEGFLGVAALPPHEQSNVRSFFPLDYVRSDDQDAVGWLERDGRIEDGIALYTMRSGVGGADITIAQYVELIVTTCGAIGDRPGRPTDARDRGELVSRVERLFARG